MAGDLDAVQRREALQRAVALHRPLAALVIFLNVVALEDFFRITPLTTGKSEIFRIFWTPSFISRRIAIA